jgi:hypothetical protein
VSGVQNAQPVTIGGTATEDMVLNPFAQPSIPTWKSDGSRQIPSADWFREARSDSGILFKFAGCIADNGSIAFGRIAVGAVRARFARQASRPRSQADISLAANSLKRLCPVGCRLLGVDL